MNYNFKTKSDKNNERRKRSGMLLCLLLLSMLGSIVQAQSRQLTEKVQVNLQATNAARIIEALDLQTNYSFSFASELLSKIEIPSFTATGITLGDALSLLQKQYGLEFAIRDGNIAIQLGAKPVKQPASKTSGKITGMIIDEENLQPLSGVTIRITDHGTVSGADGTFEFLLPGGTYRAEVSSVGYITKLITDIIIKDNETFSLNITLKKEKNSLRSVTVTATAKKESVNALFVRQKNAAEVTNGISAEQISRTPDKNVGESLNRVSGVSTNDNKYVVVRGIAERYNIAMLDGTILPSTEAQNRNFSFDLIPTNLVDNIVISKTSTPDMPVSFGGGLIQITTKDIPSQNFTSFTAGLSYNDQTTGKDFYSRKQGKYDILGFDDGHRGNYPANLQATEEVFRPQINIYNQSKQFKNNDNFTTYRNTASPSQNYQFTIGRIIKTSTSEKSKIGITGSLSYRNTQTTVEHRDLRRGKWNIARDSINNNHGATYNYNTTWGALLNIGWLKGNTRFSFRNTYTHMFDNPLVRTFGFGEDAGGEEFAGPPAITETDDPTFLNLLQNKLSGQHLLGKVKLEWNIARASVKRQEKDVIYTSLIGKRIGGDVAYFNSPGSSTEPKDLPMSRSIYENNEKHYSGGASASVPFQLSATHHTFKAGYNFIYKNTRFNWRAASFTIDGRYFTDSLKYLPVAQWGNHMDDSTGYLYAISPYGVDYYEGKSQSHAAFVMFDSRLLKNLRVIWGTRAEYYKYKDINNPTNTKLDYFKGLKDKDWQLMPSVNVTYSPLNDLNIRAAWTENIIRPELMDNSRFKRYSPYYDGTIYNTGVISTHISSYDVKAEWFPGAGEVISAGVFYKAFKDPIEMVSDVNDGNLSYKLKNTQSAKVYGLELETRKNLRFLADRDWLENIVLYGNLTLQKSEVTSLASIYDPATNKQEFYTYRTKRALSGQVPFLLNLGAQYTSKHLGMNIAYNKAGYKTNIVSDGPLYMEREMPRAQLDAQISYRLLAGKMEVKFNIGNLLNAPYQFYKNLGTREKPGFDPLKAPAKFEWSDRYEYLPGFTEKYEEGDLRTFTRFLGRTFSLSLSYNL
jgi:hypothetical protein